MGNATKFGDVCAGITDKPIYPPQVGCIIGTEEDSALPNKGELNSETNHEVTGGCPCNLNFMEWPDGEACMCTSCGCYVSSITVSDVSPSTDCFKGYWGVQGKVTAELTLPGDSKLWAKCFVGVYIELFSDAEHTELIGQGSVNCPVLSETTEGVGYFTAPLDQEMPGETVYVKATASPNMVNEDWPDLASKWINPVDPWG